MLDMPASWGDEEERVATIALIVASGVVAVWMLVGYIRDWLKRRKDRRR